MCGRFVSSSPPDQLAAYFGAEQGETLLEANYNVAPTSDIYVVLENAEIRRLEAFHWGLVPFWAKDPKIGNRMINARAETVATSNAYRAAFKRRRCLIPADGFYEWVEIAGQKKKQPVYIQRPDGQPFAFAGLWETWKGEQDEFPLQSCTVITGPPNDKMAQIHDRMPVLLAPGDWDQWLDPDDDDVASLQKLLVPAPDRLITFTAVSTEVNNVRNNGATLLEPTGPVDVVPTTMEAE
ncbi:MAG: SOS response-associated peptidase [Acidimicrobiia bacterium]|nr:SOS response-associated peptidase [Acidimicrobiia bacterium]